MRKRDELTDPNSCLNKAREDERLFVLLDRDAAFPDTVRDWIRRRIKLGLNRPGDPQLLGAERLAAEVEAEQRAKGVPAPRTDFRVESGNLDAEVKAATAEEAAEMAFRVAAKRGLDLGKIAAITPLDDVLYISAEHVLRKLGLWSPAEPS